MFFTSLRILNHIIKFIIIVCFMQYIHFLVEDGDTTQNLNTLKCLDLQSRYAITPLNFFVLSPGMSKLLKLSGGLGGD